MPRGILLSALACLVVFVLGCSGGSSTTVKGKVLLDGKALPGAEVTMIAKGKDGGKGGYMGKTDPEGNFEIKVLGGKPLPPGNYQVLIAKYVDKKGKDVDPEEYGQLLARGEARNLVPSKYSEPGASDLGAEIKAGDNVLPPFELKGSPR